MHETFRIEKRFCGPADSGQGGYVAGILSKYINGTAEVTLRMPPPLDKSLDVNRNNGTVQLQYKEHVIAEGKSIELDLNIPKPPTYQEAVDASMKYLETFNEHEFPLCFGCGPKREHGDGLRIFAERVPNKNMVASPWIPDESLAGEDGCIKPEFVWAALDCPGGYSTLTLGVFKKVLLGKLSVTIDKPERILPNEKYIIAGWVISVNGRKNHTGTALFTDDGELLAKGKATWIELK